MQFNKQHSSFHGGSARRAFLEKEKKRKIKLWNGLIKGKTGGGCMPHLPGHISFEESGSKCSQMKGTKVKRNGDVTLQQNKCRQLEMSE